MIANTSLIRPLKRSIMHQTKKSQQWYFGMKAHIGVVADSGLVHTVTTTPANVSDVMEVGKLLP